MAGTSRPTIGPWPCGEGSVVEVRIGGMLLDGAFTVIDTYVLQFDCKIAHAVLSYTKQDTNDLDAVLLKTVDATALTIVASQDMSANVAGVAQTLHSDIVGTALVRGNKIQATADSGGTTEGGTVMWTVGLIPLFA